MPQVIKTAQVKHSAQQMFDLVNDFEQYPQFLPGCRQACILERRKDYLIGKMVLAKGALKQTIVTKNWLQPPERIQLDLVQGPFKSLQGTWHFKTVSAKYCEVRLEMKFEFANRLLTLAFGPFFQQVSGQLIEAFIRRADQLYE